MTLELLVPLGLLGLIGIAVLILIYVIRPNYQAKPVTSTYIWKLSLSYKRKRPPVNKIRNIIIFICQLLILTAMALIMAWPSLVERALTDDNDVVYILDSSASMLAETDGKTRFDIAVEKLRDRAEDVLSTDGKVSIIVADKDPHFLARRTDSSRRMRLMSDLEAVQKQGAYYGTADLDGALELSREVLLENPNAKLVLFTDSVDPDKTYMPDRVEVEYIHSEGEWNAGILNATAALEDGYYTITVQVACYGISQELDVKVYVDGANSIPASQIPGTQIEFEKYIDCSDENVKTVIFRTGGGQEDDDLYYYDLLNTQRFFSYNSIRINVEADDCYLTDNNFFLYGGQKERLKVEYFSGGAQGPNPFTQTALAQAANALSSINNLQLDITEIKWHDDPILEGFDVYIFEHEMPERLPTDGAVILLDPDPGYDRSNGTTPSAAGFRVTQVNPVGTNVTLAEGEDYNGNPIMQYIVADDIMIQSYDIIADYDPAYQVLLAYDGDPIFMVRNDGAAKVAVLAFNIHYSTLAKLPENFLLMYGIFNYFYPTIISGNTFAVGEEFTLNTWGPELSFNGTDTVFTAEEMPVTYSIDRPGTYYFEQTTYYGKDIVANIFVRSPAEESNILRTEDSISDPYEGTEPDILYRDLLIILASILVGLLFLEWFLHSRENR